MMEARRKTWGLRPTTLGQKLQRSLTHSRREQRPGLSECLRLRCGRRSDGTKRVKSDNVHLKEAECVVGKKGEVEKGSLRIEESISQLNLTSIFATS